MKKTILKSVTTIFLIGIVCSQTFAQTSYKCYTVANGHDKIILIENGKLYRITIKSCWYSAYARIGTYLIYGLNISDSKTNGEPFVLTIAETSSIDWKFSYTLSGSYDANMKISSESWGDQGLLIVVEEFQCGSPTEVGDINSKVLEISPYPNPTNDVLNITYKSIPYNDVILKLFNSNGKNVKEVKLDSHKTSENIDISNLPSGVYVISIFSNTNISNSYTIIKK